MTMSKTAAIREARTFVGMPTRRSSTDYVVYAPYHSNKPHGPSTELQADSYQKCLARRSSAVASIALHLMGRLDIEADAAIESEIYDCYKQNTIETLVSAGSAAYGTGPTADDIALGAESL